MLKQHDYMQYAPREPGEIVRINHSSPSCAGDSKSLKIEMTADGTIYAKCFRCGEWGSTRSGSHKPSGFASVPKNGKPRYHIPADIDYEWAKMSVRAVAYLNKFSFTEFITSKHGIGWSPSTNRLVFPATNLREPRAGWQGKSFDGGARYLTFAKNPRLMYTHLLSANMVKGVVITEDLLSAIRVQSDELSSFAVLGTDITTEGFSELITSHKKFYVWLDNDNDIVRKKALALHNRLSMYGESQIITIQIEPKELDYTELCEVLGV